jgi:hypothetical protein
MMEMIPHSSPLCLDVYEDQTLNAAITDELRRRFDEEPPRLSLPIIWDYDVTLDDGEISKATDGWNGPPVDDPLTLDLHLPLAEEEEGVVFRCTLEEVIDDLIDSSISPTTLTIKEENAQLICRRIAARLRELAAHVEQALAPEVDA